MPGFFRNPFLLLLLVLCWGHTQNASAARNVSDKFTTVHDLQDNWLFYSADDQSYLPYIVQNNVSTKSIHFNLQAQRFPGEKLIIDSPYGLSMLVQGQYVGYFDRDTVMVFSIDSVAARYAKKNIWITLYRPDGDFSHLKTFVGKTKSLSASINPLDEIETRHQGNDKSLFSLIIIAVFAMFTMSLNVSPKDFKEFLNVSAVFTLRSVDEDIYKSRMLSKNQLAFLLVHSLMLSFLVVLYFYFSAQKAGVAFDHAIMSFWLYNGAFFFALVLAKYMLISICSLLFDMRDKVNLYFFDFIKLSVSFYGLVFLVVTAVFLSGYYHLDEALDVLFKLAIVFSFVRFAILYYKLSVGTPIKSLHLFSYLCSTELLPIVLGMKYFLS